MRPEFDGHVFLSLWASEPPSLFDKGMRYPLGQRLRPTDELWSLARHEG